MSEVPSAVRFYYDLRSRWVLFRAQFTPKGNIAVYSSFASPGPDSGDDYIFRIYSPAGEPLTDWKSGSQPLDSTGYYEIRDSY